jgi:peroxiredoxin
MPELNHPAPTFKSPNQDNEIVDLESYKGKKNVILYFYPKDDTPGCTIEANEFTKLASEFAAEDTVVIGVSKDSCESHQAFIDKYGLKVDLLADTTGELCDAYGVIKEQEWDGKKYMGIARSTFLIDKNGILIDAIEITGDVTPHPQEMLDKVRQL